MTDTELDHHALLGAAVGRFASWAAGAGGDEPVPSCPGWTLFDLVEHLGTIHRWSASIVLSGQRIPPPRPVVTDPPADWYAGTAAALLVALRAVDPEEPIPNFSRIDERAAFWPRRQLHETTVHAVDAAQALGLDETAWDVDPAIAADGVDEVLQVFFPRLTARGNRPDVRAPVRLVATDLDVSWVIAPGSDPDGPPVQRHAATHDADDSVSGRAVDLYLGLWRRVGLDRLRIDGDAAHALMAGPTSV